MPQAALVTAASAAFSGAAVGTALLELGVTYALGQFVQGMFGRKPEQRTLPGTELSGHNPAAPVHNVYGEVVKSGTIFFKASSGKNDEFLHVCYALAGHTCESIGEVEFDGVPESELLHTNTKQIATCLWTGRDTEHSDHPVGETTVSIDGRVFSSIEEINASDLPVIAETVTSTRYRVVKTITALDDGQDQFVVKIVGLVGDDVSGSVSYNDPEDDAFQIWRHTGEVNQPADAELLKRFAEGRKAKVAVSWPINSVHMMLSVNEQQIVGDIDDIIDFIESSPALDGISAERQGKREPVELLLEHSIAGRSIEVSSSTPSFSFEHLQSPAPVWTSAHQGKEVCYVHIRYSRRSEVWGNRMPDAKFRVKGKRLRDPRDSSTAWSDNWALVMLDAMGAFWRIPEDRPIIEEIAQAATVADERVVLDDVGNTQARYTVNGVISDDEDPEQVLLALQQHGGVMARRLGRPTLVPHIAQPLQAPIVDADSAVYNRPEIQLNHPRRELFNTVLPSFVGETTGWLESRAQDVSSPYYVAEDNSEALTRESTYRFAGNEYQAQRLAKIDLEQHRQQMSTSLMVGRHRLDLAAGTVVPVTLASAGWVDKLFQVVTATEYGPNHAALATSGTATVGGIKVDLREYAPEAFDWNKGEATLRDYARNTTLSPMRFVRMPAQLTITTTPAWFVEHTNNMQLAMAHVDWAEPLETNVDRYELQWRQGEDIVWRDVGEVRVTQSVIGPISDTADITVRVRAIGMHGKRSRWAEVGPVPVNSVNSITGGDGTVEVTKSTVAPTDNDTNDIWLKEGTAGGPVVAKYYWVNDSWADISGSAIATAIANAFEAKYLADGAAKLHIFPSTTTPPPTASGEGDLWLQPDLKRIMRWDGSDYVLATSMNWDDILGATKPDDLANSEGTLLNDSTFTRLRNGYNTWSLSEGAALTDAGIDGAAVVLGAGDKAVNTSPIVVPATRFIRFDLRAIHSEGNARIVIRLRAVDANGDLTSTVSSDIDFSIGPSEWSNRHSQGAVDIGNYRRAVVELEVVGTGSVTIDSIECRAQNNVPSTGYEPSASTGGLRYPAFETDGALHGYRVGASTIGYYGGSCIWPESCQLTGGRVELRCSAAYIQQPGAFEIDATVQYKSDTDEWVDIDSALISVRSGELIPGHRFVFALPSRSAATPQFRVKTSYSRSMIIYSFGLHGDIMV